MFFLSSVEAFAERRALVVSVSDYDQIPDLSNASRDGEIVANSLRDIGFTVEVLEDATASSLIGSETISKRPELGDTTFVYIASHGIQVMGENFLLMKDAKLDKTSSEGILPLARLIKFLESENGNLIIALDACRNDPFNLDEDETYGFLRQFQDAYAAYAVDTKQLRGLANRSSKHTLGLSRVDFPPANTLLAYSTRAGAASFDGPNGGNGPYASALADELRRADVDVFKVLRLVRDRVLKESGGLQEPFVYGSVGGADIYLNPKNCPCDAISSPPEFFACQSAAAPMTEDFPTGKSVSSIDPQVAIPVCNVALDLDPDNPALHFWMGRAMAAARRDEEARDHYMVAAQNGIGPAMHNLAMLYDGGRGLDFDSEKAFYWLQRAVAKGIVPSRSNLAWYYETGRGGSQDFAKAFELYSVNAEWGEAFSQRKLGFFYRDGVGVPEDIESAIKWFNLASLDGDDLSMRELGLLLLAKGEISPGLDWLLLALSGGVEDARADLTEISQRQANDGVRQELVREVLGVDGKDSVTSEILLETMETKLAGTWPVQIRERLLAGTSRN